jgi:hypothetical protein
MGSPFVSATFCDILVAGFTLVSVRQRVQSMADSSTQSSWWSRQRRALPRAL